MIVKRCTNCVYQGYDVCDKCDFENHELFTPFEDMTREDEKQKVYKEIKQFIVVNMRNGAEDTLEKLLKEVKEYE